MQFSDIRNPTLIGLDIGSKKIGVAIFFHEMNMTLPLSIMVRKNLKNDIEEINKIMKKYNSVGIVIGEPLNSDGSTNAQVKKMVKLQKIIEKKLGVPVFLYDERLTTQYANDILKEALIKRKQRNKIDDMVAAQLILEEFVQQKL